ncbi:hypothetical protein Tco_0953580 [Tanacetum coccineum]|uniref:Uncharacterized protein n=1 Tax=Tanacetum coccineum TaxID=301880 RepID=A0ABQ5E0B2_9ASTR
MDVEEGYDLDDFDMDIDCDSDVEFSKERKKGLRALSKESKNKVGHFYVRQEFADKKDVQHSAVKLWQLEGNYIVKPNLSIPVKALKEQMQKKYQVGISIGKVKRARAASIIKVKGDFSERYSLLRDYFLELQRTNEDTTMKIDLERDYNPSKTRSSTGINQKENKL